MPDNAGLSVTAIQAEVLELPANERARLIDVLWDSLSEPELKARESAWAAESERRIDAYDAGKLTARDAQDVFADLKESLTTKRTNYAKFFSHKRTHRSHRD